jgi:GNAT superfamily N-acetyltransferase
MARRPATRAALDMRPLTPRLMEDLRAVLAGGWGASCWCMYPRLGEAGLKALPGTGTLNARKREAMTALARSKRAPGLIAFVDGVPVGWVAVAPRSEFKRIDASRATPPVDDQPIWVIPCVTVARRARGRGIAVALIRAAVDYAIAHGAPAVEAYPRAGTARVAEANAYFGTEPMFRRAGFEIVRGIMAGQPKNRLPRVTMRAGARRPTK